MKILFVTPFLATPPRFGAERRLDGLARELAKRHEVSLLWFNADNATIPPSLAAKHGYCHRIATTDTALVAPKSRRSLQACSLLSARSFESLQAAGRADFRDLLQQMLDRTPFDVVQFESLRVTYFNPRVGSAAATSPLLVFDEHNVEYDLVRRATASTRSPLRRIYGEVNWRKLAREERAAWQACDGVLFTSERDRAQLRAQVAGTPSALIPNGVDLRAFSQCAATGEPGLLLFFGALNYFPNEQGLLHFIDRVLPELKRRDRTVRLLVVGPGAPASLLRRQSDTVRIVGEVDDVTAYLERASVVIVPVTVGGGTRLKIVEALARGKPVVSTSLGAEGLATVAEEHLLIADDSKGFARQVQRVLDDPELARRLGSEGRRLVERFYDWRSIAATLEAFYVELAGRRAQRSVTLSHAGSEMVVS